MNSETQAVTQHGDDHQQHFILDIEGRSVPWSSPTITTEEIATLGGWTSGDGVIEVDADNVERTLTPGEIVHLKPGHGFSKKVKFTRGDNLYEQRLSTELEMLRGRYPDVQMLSGWFRIPIYPTFNDGWNRAATAVAFQAQAGYPATQPYGIYVPAGLRFKDAMATNYQEPVANRPPFEGEWGMFSWAPDGGAWRPTTDPRAGTNLLNFAIGIAKRFKEGA